MTRTHQAKSDEDHAQVRALFWEYLEWANGRVNEEFGIDFDIESILDEDMADLEIFSPPDGRLLLATAASQTAGIGCIRRIGQDLGEIKRMYVRPECRGMKIGRTLLDTLISEAREIGYQTLRLDVARCHKEAISLYRSAGFKEVAPYPESEIPDEFKKYWVFMEMPL